MQKEAARSLQQSTDVLQESYVSTKKGERCTTTQLSVKMSHYEWFLSIITLLIFLLIKSSNRQLWFVTVWDHMILLVTLKPSHTGCSESANNIVNTTKSDPGPKSVFPPSRFQYNEFRGWRCVLWLVARLMTYDGRHVTAKNQNESLGCSLLQPFFREDLHQWLIAKM